MSLQKRIASAVDDDVGQLECELGTARHSAGRGSLRETSVKGGATGSDNGVICLEIGFEGGSETKACFLLGGVYRVDGTNQDASSRRNGDALFVLCRPAHGIWIESQDCNE